MPNDCGMFVCVGGGELGTWYCPEKLVFGYTGV